VAESFGADARRYDRSRPRYPQELVARILAESPGREVLDVGSGTGIAARQFQAAGARVLGIEPDARMAELARLSNVDVEVSTFEAWDPGGRMFDAVVAARPALESYAMMCATAGDGMRTAGGFGEPEQWRYEWTWTYSRDDWLDQLPTFGGNNRLPADQLARILAGVGDAVGGSFVMDFTTMVLTASTMDSPAGP
jgi:SAM-dependent methyltransferase